MSGTLQEIRSPFKFLDPYGKDDREVFFGRNDEAEALYEAVNKNRLVLVYGPSGTGKTSLVQCGLANRFEVSDWLPFFIRRGQNLNDSLRLALSQSKALGGQIVEEDDQQIIKAIERISTRYLRPVYLIFDQFEELLIIGGEDEKKKFIETVRQIVSSDESTSCCLLFILREEYYLSLEIFERQIPGFYNRRLRVEPMSSGTIENVIYKSCKHFNIHFEDDQKNPKQIAGALSGKGGISLPYLQVYLDRLWREDYVRTPAEEREEKGLTFTTAEIEEFGTIDDVLRKLLEERKQKIQEQLTEAWGDLPANFMSDFLDVFVTTNGTKRPVLLDWTIMPELRKEEDKFLYSISQKIVEAALSKLEESRLLRRVDNAWELSHDSLAAFIYSQRSAERRQLDAVLKSLGNYYQEYLNSDKKVLLHPVWLEKNLEYLSRMPLEMQEFIRASRERVEQREQEKRGLEEEKKRQQEELLDSRMRELETQHAAVARQRKLLKALTAISIAMLGLAVLAVFYLYQAKTKTCESLLSSADMLKEKREFDLAIKQLKDAQTKEPFFQDFEITAKIDTIQMLQNALAKADSLVKQGNLMQAKKIYERAQQADPTFMWLKSISIETDIKIRERFKTYLKSGEVLAEENPEFKEPACAEFKKALEFALSGKDREIVKTKAVKLGCHFDFN